MASLWLVLLSTSMPALGWPTRRTFVVGCFLVPVVRKSSFLQAPVRIGPCGSKARATPREPVSNSRRTQRPTCRLAEPSAKLAAAPTTPRRALPGTPNAPARETRLHFSYARKSDPSELRIKQWPRRCRCANRLTRLPPDKQLRTNTTTRDLLNVTFSLPSQNRSVRATWPRIRNSRATLRDKPQLAS